jgi:hypothetical protein
VILLLLAMALTIQDVAHPAGPYSYVDQQADYNECVRIGLKPQICEDQRKHDTNEREMYGRLDADEAKIFAIWRPSPKLLSDYRAARRCYTQFHLYKVEGCDKEIGAVDLDLAGAKE